MKDKIAEWLFVKRYTVDKLWFKLTCLAIDLFGVVGTALLFSGWGFFYWFGITVGSIFVGLDVYVIQKDKKLGEIRWRTAIALRLWKLIDRSLYQCVKIVLDIPEHFYYKTQITPQEMAMSEAVGRKKRKGL